MISVDGKCGCTVRIVVRLRPDEYDQLVRHVREIGSTTSLGREELTMATIYNTFHDEEIEQVIAVVLRPVLVRPQWKPLPES
jgi:hypothetical protein